MTTTHVLETDGVDLTYDVHGPLPVLRGCISAAAAVRRRRGSLVSRKSGLVSLPKRERHREHSLTSCRLPG